MGYLVCLEKKDSKDFLEFKVHLVYLDLQGLQLWVLLAHPVFLEKGARKVMKVHLEFLFLDLLDLMDNLGLLAFRDLQALLALTSLLVVRYVNQALQALQDLQVIKDSKENKE